MRVGLTTSIATAIAVGVLIASGGGNPPASGANLWVDTSGGTCTRSASLANYVDASACASLAAAYTAASCGDTVLIKGGTYGSQTPSGTKACAATWAINAARGASCSSCVQFKVADSESVTLGGLTLDATYFYVQRGGGTALSIGGVGTTTSNTPSNVIVQDADITAASYFLPPNSANAITNVALVGGSLGGFGIGDGTRPCCGFYLQTCGSCTAGTVLAHDFLIDGMTFHDMPTCAPNTGGCGPDPHTELVRIDGGWTDVTIRNSTFIDQANTSITTSTIFVTNLDNGGVDPSNIVMANNYFEDLGNNAFISQAVVSNCDFQFYYNTARGGLLNLNNCTTTTGSEWVGNLGYKPVASCWGTYSKNVWQHNVNTACGTDTWVNGTSYSTDQLGINSNFSLAGGSPAIRAGETTVCPATDHDGNTRPNPGATNCDAGAYESSS